MANSPIPDVPPIRTATRGRCWKNFAFVERTFSMATIAQMRPDSKQMKSYTTIGEVEAQDKETVTGIDFALSGGMLSSWHLSR